LRLGEKAEGGEKTVKTMFQISLLRNNLPYLLLAVAGAADLATTLIGVKAAGLAEGNSRFTPFLTQTILILYIFLVRKIPVFPQKIMKVCEAGLVIYSFSPAIWNLSLILTSMHV
jgi:hypothetical protein